MFPHLAFSNKKSAYPMCSKGNVTKKKKKKNRGKEKEFWVNKVNKIFRGSTAVVEYCNLCYSTLLMNAPASILHARFHKNY